MANNSLDHVYVVVLAGGSGTRLWPMSRDNTPKQFLKLGGDRTLMQSAVDRILPMIPWERIIVVTNAAYTEEVRAQLPQIPSSNIIAEPMKRDTAAAMALGSLVAQYADPEAVVVNMASDHVLKDSDEYRRVITAAADLAANKEYLVTVGITPTSPNVNFGYIEVADEIERHQNYPVLRVESFKEKPDKATAEKFLKSGNYYWNANMYTWHVDTIFDAFARHMPAMMPHLEQIRAAIGTDQFATVLDLAYREIEKISIDYAISEKAQNLVLIEGDFGWDDVGLWSTVYQLGEKDANQTVAVREGSDLSPILAVNSERNLISTNKRLVALLGVSDLVVVDSDDVILVLPREQAADVKKVVELLKEQGLDQYL